MEISNELFKGKSFSDLLKDIYDNSKKKDRQINLLIAELKPLIKSIGDATMIVPLIATYMEISVKNDEHLVKLAAVAQRLMSAAAKANPEAGDFGLTEEEKAALLKEIDSISGDTKAITETIQSVQLEQKSLNTFTKSIDEDVTV